MPLCLITNQISFSIVNIANFYPLRRGAGPSDPLFAFGYHTRGAISITLRGAPTERPPLEALAPTRNEVKPLADFFPQTVLSAGLL